ncbi:hypothetical protein CONPUDRAFT_135045 [Coniophora puteana RWD-64-598 SS2]|uniref:NF-X1-type domain-containing protein n=1 Tax=Coniophora puteana (strain RWD-64-598) TaxID=741705 RepID=A0A5M3N1E8_CONPW|nr:uncharacterized protein CONPUDRAFT_135045 [Coniophora puteana RWD-64-598 SS2]EIW85230.1 hypothetical protein CONPUDRAFT_135045 [Coniophora puteana RWD-64-598 SS2]
MEAPVSSTAPEASSSNSRGTRSKRNPRPHDHSQSHLDQAQDQPSARGRGQGQGARGGPSRARGRGRGGQPGNRANPQPEGQQPGNRPKEKSHRTPAPTAGDSQTDRPGTLPTQDKKPHGRRAAKFKGSLTTATDDAPDASTHKKPAGKTHPPRRAAEPDTLAGRLAHALQTPPYADCPICFNSIHPAAPTWSCAPPTLGRADQTDEKPDTDSKDDCCWTTFHLKCIKSWASKSVKDLEAAWRARGEERPGEWRCPGCQARRMQVPSEYKCFCGQSTLTPSGSRNMAHSCAAPCARPRRLCTHSCPLPCHPGPCPPCNITVRQQCWCKKEERAWRCSEISRSHRSLDAISDQSGVSCAQVCDKPLSCGNPEHRCAMLCHPGPCTPCEEEEQVLCFCGKQTKRVKCGEDRQRAVSCSVEGENWEGRFMCDGACERPFACGTHTCSLSCHPPSSRPPTCPFDPVLMTNCPCGRISLGSGNEYLLVISATPNDPKDPSLPRDHKHPPPGYLPRTSCTTPVPTCLSLCTRPHAACGHPCEARCHPGQCPPCAVRLRRACRCGSHVREVVCGEEGEGRDWACGRVCNGMLNCRRHRCTRACCPLASLSAAAAGKRKAAAGALELDDDQDGGLHTCELICGKVLGCGNHTCERRDHRGVCGNCLRSEFTEMICPCSRTILDPPIPCGTRLECSYSCNRPQACGHPVVPHACHAASRIRASTGQEEWIVAGAEVPWAESDNPQQEPDDENVEQTEGGNRELEWQPSPCPPCPFLVRKQCACGKKEVDNVRCAQDRSRVSCGTVCGRLLACGYHSCSSTCHPPPCGACAAPCGKPRRSCLPAHHPCTAPCHAPASCPEDEPCLAPVTLTCACGRMRSVVPCMRATPSNNAGGRASADPDIREGALKCTPDCAAAKRRAQLAEALGIAPDKRGSPPALGQGRAITYSDELLVSARREGPKFVALAEKALADFVNGDRSTQVLPHMPPERRGLVQGLASVYRLDATMVDAEPHRSVQLGRRIDCRVPVPLLSQVVFGADSGEKKGLGRLTDLRGGKLPVAYGVSASGSSTPLTSTRPNAWTSVVSRPASSSTPPVASGWTTPRSSSPAPVTGRLDVVAASRHAAAARTSASALVTSGPPSRQRTPVTEPVSAPTPAPPPVPAEDVPNDWEDDA